MLINKAFKSEIHINDSLKSIFNQFLGNRRFIYNQLLSIVENSPIKSINLDGEKTYSIKSRKNLQEVCSYLSNKYEFLSNSHTSIITSYIFISFLFNSYANLKLCNPPS
mgnify:CR=1 FL=1